ncbi:MAG: hypothetical protein Kow0092_20200 [Deferrisomatales bacterium]
MGRWVGAAGAIVLLVAAQGAARARRPLPADPIGIIVRAESRTIVSFRALLRELGAVRFVFVGEEHDNAAHHRIQYEMVRGMADAGLPVAVAVEMFRADAQETLDRWTAGALDPGRLRELFARQWSEGFWDYYEALFELARARAIPLGGLNVDREGVRQVADLGFDLAERRGRLPVDDVRCDVSARYQDRMALVLGWEDRDTLDFEHFCEAQVTWDAAMAENLLRFARRHPRRHVVVLAGALHAWKHGVPEQVRRRSPLAYRVILPVEENPFGGTAGRGQDADFLWWHP